MTYAKSSCAFLALILSLFFLLMSCDTNKKAVHAETAEITELKAHQWYCFSRTGISEVDLPQNTPEIAILPWTEAVRMMSAGSRSGVACALVNRLGVLDFSSGRPELVRDVQLFTDVTADSLLFTLDGPVFHLYRNAHFNTAPKNLPGEERPLLVRYDASQRLCVPVLSYADFGIPDGAEMTSILPKDGGWLAVVKTAGQDKTDFKYMRFSSPEEDGSIPNPDAAAITATEIDADTFRVAQMPLPFDDAPQLLKRLFEAVPQPFEFYLSCRTEGQAAAVLYDNTVANSPVGGFTSQGCAVVFPDSGAVAVFSDGTVYASNTLLKGDLSAEGVTVFRLPRLPAGFVYGELVVCGSMMYVAWEESDFYKTGRSGFIAVNMEEVSRHL